MYEHTAPTLEAAYLYTKTVREIDAEDLTLSQHVRAAYDALHIMGLAEQAQRDAAQAQLDAIKAQVAALDTAGNLLRNSPWRDNPRELVRADFLDDNIIAGMFAAMTHDDMTNPLHVVPYLHDDSLAGPCLAPDHGVAYGEQTFIGVIEDDYANMFDLK